MLQSKENNVVSVDQLFRFNVTMDGPFANAWSTRSDVTGTKVEFYDFDFHSIYRFILDIYGPSFFSRMDVSESSIQLDCVNSGQVVPFNTVSIPIRAFEASYSWEVEYFVRTDHDGMFSTGSSSSSTGSSKSRNPFAGVKHIHEFFEQVQDMVSTYQDSSKFIEFPVYFPLKSMLDYSNINVSLSVPSTCYGVGLTGDENSNVNICIAPWSADSSHEDVSLNTTITAGCVVDDMSGGCNVLSPLVTIIEAMMVQDLVTIQVTASSIENKASNGDVNTTTDAHLLMHNGLARDKTFFEYAFGDDMDINSKFDKQEFQHIYKPEVSRINNVGAPRKLETSYSNNVNDIFDVSGCYSLFTDGAGVSFCKFDYGGDVEFNFDDFVVSLFDYICKI